MFPRYLQFAIDFMDLREIYDEYHSEWSMEIARGTTEKFISFPGFEGVWIEFLKTERVRMREVRLAIYLCLNNIFPFIVDFLSPFSVCFSC
jgi:hypothetical protein